MRVRIVMLVGICLLNYGMHAMQKFSDEKSGEQLPQFSEIEKHDCRSVWLNACRVCRSLLGEVRKGNVQEVSNVLKQGVCLEIKDESGSTALILASIYGFSDIVMLLLDHKAVVET